MRKCLGFFLFFFLLLIFSSSVYAQSEDDFEVYLQFSHRGVINSYVIAYYDGEEFNLPVKELFELLHIEANVNDIVISGKFALEQTPYSIDLRRQTIVFGDQSYSITTDDYILTDLDTYLPPRYFSEIFGLDFSVDFNNLTLRLETEVEIPIIQQFLRRAKLKLANTNRRDVSYYPIGYGLERKIVDGGFLDYSVGTNLSSELSSFNYSSSLGLQLLGGDLQGSLFGNFSSESSVFESNNLRWKTLIRNNSWLSSITVGQSNTDGVFMNSYTGIRISNEPIEPRRLFDEFELQGTTIPQSEIELYLDNALIDFSQADEFGNYRFLVPQYYGTTQLDIRIYGPTGQVIQQRNRQQIPFNFVPQGEFDYRINAGVLDNRVIGKLEREKTLQANVSYGINRWLSSKVGMEYYSTEIGKNIPFYTATLSSRIARNYILTLEGVTDGYLRSSVNAVYPNSASLNFDFTNFTGESNFFNSSNNDYQFIGNVFFPIKIFNQPFGLRYSNFTRVREGVSISTIRTDVSAKISRINFRLGYTDRIIDSYNIFNSSGSGLVESAITYNFSRNPNIPKFIRGTFIRSQFRFLPSTNEFQQGEVLVSRSVFNQGRIQASFGRNFQGQFNTIRLNFVIDFGKVRSNSTSTFIRGNTSASQTVRGSIGYDSNFNNFIWTSRNQVGRSATAVRFFVDNNTNGVYEESEDELLDDINLRLGRSGASSVSKNGILYYTQLNSYFRYNVELNQASIKNPMLVPEEDKFSIITDPNSFKLIDIPFNMSGVMEGNVARIYEGGLSQGIGGLKVLLTDLKENEVKELRTFSDGSFYEYPIRPGDYRLEIDPSQLSILQSRSEPELINFEVETTRDGDFVEGLNFELYPLDVQQQSQEDSLAALTIAQVTDEIKSSPEILEYSQEVFKEVDNALRLIIKAQNAFYSNNIDLAFRYVNESLELFETAQAHALKGSFYYFEGNIDQAQRHWEQALRFNPDLVIPDMEVLEERVNRRASD